MVSDGYPHVVLVKPGRHLNQRSIPGVLEGVVEEINQGLRDQRKVHGDGRHVRGNINRYTTAVTVLSKLHLGCVDGVMQVARLDLKMDGSALEAGHLQQVADQAVEALGFLPR